jgi:hypothetical protein
MDKQSSMWPKLFCHGCGRTGVYHDYSKYCLVCVDYQKEQQKQSTMIKCSGCENMIPSSSKGPYCCECDGFYCNFTHGDSQQFCTNIRQRCLCGRETISNFCNEHQEEKRKKRVVVPCVSISSVKKKRV